MRRALASLVLVSMLAMARVAPSRAQDGSPVTRAALAHQLYDAHLARLRAGAGAPDDVHTWSVHWMEAELEQHTTSAAQSHFDRMTALLTLVHGSVAAGVLTASAELECQYYVAEARAWLAHPPARP
jgi:hypothetical protein